MQSTKKYQSALAWKQSRSEALSRINASEHRYETFVGKKGLTYINDSKATDISSVLQSLELTEQPVTLVLGVSEFDENYFELLMQVKYKVLSLIVFGKRSDQKLKQTLGVFVDCYFFTDDIEEAINMAVDKTKIGGAVLFSPGCPSHDYFSSYIERGNYFKNLVASN